MQKIQYQSHSHSFPGDMSNVVVVLDNGGGLIKAGLGGERDPSTVLPNCLLRPLSSKKWLHPSPTIAASSEDPLDLTSAAVRRPLDRGYLINPDLQRDIWAHLFNSLLHISPSQSSLLLTEPLFALPSIQRATDELVFEDFNFSALYVADSPSLAHLYETSRRHVVSRGAAQCSLVVDCGFSFTHAAPVFQNFTLNYAVKRIDLGGKALTNYLKELVSYRSVNVMDETFLMDDVKEKLCFVSLDVARDLGVARKPGKKNLLRCTYVLPDGVTHTKGFVKDPDQAQRYLSLTDGAPPSNLGAKVDMDHIEVTEKPEDRKRIDLTKNEFDLTNERFLVPEMLFHPADLGMNQAGLAECIVRAVNSCHPHLHPILYESIILTGGSTLFPRFAERLERELRPLVPDDYQVKMTTQENPILGVWRGGSLLASSPDFEAMCVTKSEYEELGSARCRRRFFH
ncbi:actin-related protein 6 [Juglans microcarpa x Juglans regia]|uniref:actin-related protein 6 n=1 Tax=Juglans microcarpa x Juglans regia TaxID=2249226 RepID=UPI001B7F2171|nr:actin-related protein 6 [Juglans microcarpa x Juglans regia]